jgi:hypothetical protein
VSLAQVVVVGPYSILGVVEGGKSAGTIVVLGCGRCSLAGRDGGRKCGLAVSSCGALKLVALAASMFPAVFRCGALKLSALQAKMSLALLSRGAPKLAVRSLRSIQSKGLVQVSMWVWA